MQETTKDEAAPVIARTGATEAVKARLGPPAPGTSPDLPTASATDLDPYRHL